MRCVNSGGLAEASSADCDHVQTKADALWRPPLFVGRTLAISSVSLFEAERKIRSLSLSDVQDRVNRIRYTICVGDIGCIRDG